MATKMKHICRSWSQAADLHRRLARTPKHGGPPRVNLGYATWLHRYEVEGEEFPFFAVKFHATNVVEYRYDGTLVLRTGGWLTLTTASRIDDYTPAEVFVRTHNLSPRRSRQSIEALPVFEIVVGRGEDADVHDMSRASVLRIGPIVP